MENKMLGQYEIKGKIGQGGMANVFLGYDTSLGREVAIKVLDTYFAREPAFAARFEREARTVTGLEHSHIVPVYDYGRFKGLPYLVMRFMRGGSLKKRLEKGPLTLIQAKPIIQRVASALDYAHAIGIIHRDLKPDNILFDQENNAFLADFGVVKLAESSTTYTQTGNTLGTPAYMSPEQAQAVEQLDHRSDIYSLGVILYEMLTGDIPYKADSSLGQAMMHVLEPVPRILKANPDLPKVCETIVQKAMAKDRDDRYASASELAEALEMATRSDAASANVATVVTASEPIEPASTLPGSVMASSIERFRLDMRPTEVKGQGLVRVLIHNEGNYDSTYTISGWDPGEAIQIDVPRRRLKVAAGHQGSIDVNVSSKKRPFLGRNQLSSFQIHVSTPTGDPQSLTGKLQIHPIIPAWLLLAVLGLFLLAAGAFFYLRGEEPSAVAVAVTDTPTFEATTQTADSETVFANIYSHQFGFTLEDADILKRTLEENGIPAQVLIHRDPNPPDAIFIGALVGAEEARIAISSVPYEIKYIFRPDYPAQEGGDPSGFLIGIGYMSTHYQDFRDSLSEPVEVSAEDLMYLTEPGLSNSEFQRRLREITQF